MKQFRDDYGYEGEVRKASDAMEYAAATVEVGKEMGVEVLDVWGLCMKLAGWRGGDGEVLPGSEKGGKSEVLAGLLCDGEFRSLPSTFALLVEESGEMINCECGGTKTDEKNRTPSLSRRIQSRL